MKLRLVALPAASVALSLSLAACGSADTPEATDDAPTTTPSATSESTPEEPSTEESTPAAPAGGGETPAWAEPVVTKGEKIGEITAEGIKVEVYQVAKGKAEEDSMFVDKESGENIMPKGSPVVFLNYVVTNTGSEPFPLGHSLVSISGKYADWPYMQGMPGESHSSAYEAIGLTNRGKKVGEDAPYVFGPGQTYNQADSYLYQGPKELELEVRATPVDADGDLDHDKKVTAEGTVTLK